jgi:parallel beta-helix repeat protein
VKLKKLSVLFIVILAATLVLSASTTSTFAVYSEGVTIVINSDGSVTPSSAPVVRSGNTYLVTDDILMPQSTNEGIKVERDNIVLDGAGHKLQGNGQSCAIYLKGRVNVTITGFVLDNFYWGLEIWSSTKCTFSDSDLAAVFYSIYIVDSSNNKFYHNNIYMEPSPYYLNSSNTWDNGYPSGGNYWEGYPYADVKTGADQNLPGADGIGDVRVGEEIFNQGGINVDNYPLMDKQVISNSNSNPSVSPSASALPVETSNPTDEPSTTATINPTPSPSIPEFSSIVLIGLFIIPAVAGALLYRKKQLQAQS